MDKTCLYQIQWDAQYTYVIAPSFAAAIEMWHAVEASIAFADGSYEWDPDEQPESVTLIHEGAVFDHAHIDHYLPTHLNTEES